MSKRETNKAANRLSLIKSAAEAFAVYGVKGANINTISLNAGLGKGTVYNYFPSKNELYLAVLDWLGLGLSRAINNIDKGNGPAAARLRPLIEAAFTFLAASPDRAKLLIRAVADQDVGHQRRAMAACQTLLDRLQQVLDDGLATGELRSDLDPFISAVTLWGMINHQAAFHWLVSSRPLDPAALTDLVATYFLRGLTRR